MRIIENLTAKQKAVIRRDYLIANFKDAFGNNATASLLLDFAQSICPKNLPISKTDIMKCTKATPTHRGKESRFAGTSHAGSGTTR